MVLRPSSYAILIQPTTQPKRTNPQPNPNKKLLRVTIVNIIWGSTISKALSVGLEVVKSVFLSSC